MTEKETRLANIRRHADKMRQLADTYAELVKMAEQEGSGLAPVLDLSGYVVAEKISEAGQILSELLKNTKEELNDTSRPNDGENGQ